MKLLPVDPKLLQNMQPSKFSSEGFLGTDTRTIGQIIEDDKQALAGQGLTVESFIKHVEQAYYVIRSRLGGVTEIRPGVTGIFSDAMGLIPSPIPGDGLFEKGEALITDVQTGESIRLTPLAIHLARTYGFLQGAGSPYRIDPQQVMRVLKIES